MFNGSSNIVIQGGTFIIVGSLDSASLERIVSAESNHKHGGSIPIPCASYNQGPTTNQFSYRNPSQAANTESCKPQVDPALGSHSAENFGASPYTPEQVPEYSPYLTPTPPITSEVKSRETMSTPMSVESVGASSTGSAKPNDDSHAPPFHSQPSNNTVRTRSRSIFGSVIQLVLNLIILSMGAHRQRLLATMLRHPHTHTHTQPLLPLSRSPN